jgi:hypothetical protein
MTTQPPDLADAEAVAHARLASTADLTDEQVAYLEQVGTERDEFTDLECVDIEADGDHMLATDIEADGYTEGGGA